MPTIIDAVILCLALNVHFEARSDPIEGQQAVALVTINRSIERNKSVCEVVFEPNQFSWTKQDKIRFDPRKPAWNKSLEVAIWAVSSPHDFTNGATHFHHETVVPRWSKKLQFVGKWGSHLFYKKGNL